MNIGVVGTGYVGLVVGACLAENGNFVVCVDNDAAKVKRLRQGEIPIYEPGLNELVPRNVAEERLRFTTDLAEAVRGSEVLFIAVGTPQDEDGSADLTHVLDVAREIGRAMNGLQDPREQVDGPGRDRRPRARGGGRAHQPPVRGRLEPGVPQGRHGRRRLPEARPRRDRHRRPEGRGGDAQALRAVRAHRQADPGDGPGLGRAHQVRGERHAGLAHLVHERDRQLLRPRGRGRPAGAPGDGRRQPDRLVVPVPGRGLRRLVLSEGREGAAADGRGGGGRPARRGRHRAHQRGPEGRAGAAHRRPPGRAGGQAHRGLGARLQAAHRRHARGSRDHRDRGPARGRRRGARLRPEGGGAGALLLRRPHHALRSSLRGRHGSRRARGRDRVERVPRAGLRARSAR